MITHLNDEIFLRKAKTKRRAMLLIAALFLGIGVKVSTLALRAVPITQDSQGH